MYCWSVLVIFGVDAVADIFFGLWEVLPWGHVLWHKLEPLPGYIPIGTTVVELPEGSDW